MAESNYSIRNIKEVKKHFKKYSSSFLTIKEIDEYSRTDEKKCCINTTLRLQQKLINESITIADKTKISSRLIEITVIAEWFLCTFNVKMIRNKSFLSELNYTIDRFNTTYNLDKLPSEHTNNSKRFKRTSKSFIAMIICNLIDRQGQKRSKNDSEMGVIIDKIKKALCIASKFDPVYQLIEEGEYDMPAADCFYSLIKNEIEAFSNNRLKSIFKEFYDKFSDNEKRCTRFDQESEDVHCEWYNKEYKQ